MDSLSSNMKNISSLIGKLSGVLGAKRSDITQLGSSYKVISSLEFIFDLPQMMQTKFDEHKFEDVIRIYKLAETALNKYTDLENLVKLVEAPMEKIETVANAVELLLQTGKNEREVERLLLKAAQASLRDDLKKLKDEQSVDVLDLSLQFVYSESDPPRLASRPAFPPNALLTSGHARGLNVQTLSIDLIRQVSKHEIAISRSKIADEMRATVQEIRQSLLNPHNCDLAVLANKLEQQFIFHVKTALANLLLFTASDVTFSSLAPQVFQQEFSKCVHEDLLVATFGDLANLAQEYGNVSGELLHVSPILLLLFSVALFHMTGKSASYLLNLCREQFCLAAASNKLTNGTDITNQLKNSTQLLIRRFCEQKGLQLGENLAKGCDFVRQPVASPTGVRAAVRRAVEEASEVERMLTDLLGGGEARKEPKQRRTQMPDVQPRDSLWCERIDFHQNIHLNKASIMTAIIKVMLKTFIELLRLQTYGKYGIEQIQVDCYYLQRCLSPLVADEVVVNSMVDVALSSALKRSLDPVLVHPSRLMQISKMGPDCLFKLLLGTNWALFLWELYINYRQYKVHLKNEKRPKEVEELIETEDYEKARNYKLDKHRFNFWNMIVSQITSTFLLCYGWLPWLWYATSAAPLHSVVFIVLNNIMETIIGLPWELYDTFVIEEKHGFNKQTLGFYLKDKVKKMVVMLAITAPIVLALEWIVENGGPYFFVYVWVFLSLVLFVLITIYPAFIAPLFDKYIPLPDGELKTAIENLASSVEYPLKKLYVVYGSKRSAHSNAYMYGFWKNKRIVLYDTLLSGEEKEKVIALCKEAAEADLDEKDKARGMSNDEVVAVLGHELGHWALYHTLINLVISELNMFFMLAIFAYFYKWQLMYEAFGFYDMPTFIGLIIVFTYVTALYNQISAILMSIHSRKCEFQADKYAADMGKGEMLISALLKLGKDNLSLPVDDYLYSMCTHSHPPIPERVRAIREKKTE
ncbi:hypothetical protein WR25_16794 isoform C [Diploscapter pachys]|uniref:Ste24 endopeptidase n=2 Tax=Diploscapter pachys TaxID=2018661 RepID=A0A2A2L1X9_9BILA|nr:hypothetical protein WR25_16794 isoform A [Diploscapter pachys]PAV80263.1 hypothetical protein WR25_16794 isoform C [Diploscapter pachys]